MSSRSFRKPSNGPLRSPRFSSELESGLQRAFCSSDRLGAVRRCLRELLPLRVKLTSSPSRVLRSSANGVRESEKAIREVFRRGRTAAPSIIFFDELDSVASRRGRGFGDGDASERVISQLLTEMDGIESLVNVVVIGASNRPDMIDPAILRPGRFDRLIYVPAPDRATCLQILKIHARDMPLAKDVDLDQIASQAACYSGADLEAVCREAGLISLRRDIETKSVTMEDFRDAFYRVKPSVTPDMENWYQGFRKRFKKERAPVAVT